jgi:single-strand DNA-binding protein
MLRILDSCKGRTPISEKGQIMNKAIFTGNLTRDPETKVMTNGKARCMFTLAVSRTYTNSQGQREADFITVIGYEKNAELVQKYLSKGRKVLVETHVKTGSYEKEGKRIYTTEFILDRVEFLSSAQQTQQAAQGETASAPDYASGGFTEVEDDELPF